MAAVEIFKTVFKGYQKEEVIAYIEKLNRKAEDLQKELEETKSALLRLQDEKSEEINAQKQTEEDQAALREAIVAEITPQIRAKAEEELRAEIEEELRNRMQAQQREDQSDLEDIRRRAQLYDDNREVLAELMIQAKNDAAQTIQDAEDQARRMREEADQRFRLLTSDYDALKNNLIASKEELSIKLYGILKQLDEFEQKFSCTEQDIAHSAEHLQEQ